MFKSKLNTIKVAILCGVSLQLIQPVFAKWDKTILSMERIDADQLQDLKKTSGLKRQAHSKQEGNLPMVTHAQPKKSDYKQGKWLGRSNRVDALDRVLQKEKDCLSEEEKKYHLVEKESHRKFMLLNNPGIRTDLNAIERSLSNINLNIENTLTKEETTSTNVLLIFNVEQELNNTQKKLSQTEAEACDLYFKQRMLQYAQKQKIQLETYSNDQELSDFLKKQITNPANVDEEISILQSHLTWTFTGKNSDEQERNFEINKLLKLAYLLIGKNSGVNHTF